MARVSLLAGELDRTLARLDVGEAHDPPLRLRDRLLRDHEHVAVLEAHRGGDQRAEVGSGFDLRQPLDAEDRDQSPVTRTPACAL